MKLLKKMGWINSKDKIDFIEILLDVVVIGATIVIIFNFFTRG